MAQPTYPAATVLEVIEEGDMDAIHAQLKLVAEHYPGRTREFACRAATAVAKVYCQHREPPPALPASLSVAQRRVAANAHAGLCGVHLAYVIAGLRFADVSATALRRNVPVTYTVFRNQVCVSHRFYCTLPEASCASLLGGTYLSLIHI